MKFHADRICYRLIAKECDLSVDTVGTIVCKWKSTGTTVNRSRSGRPRKIDDHAARVIVRMVTQKPQTIRGEMQKYFDDIEEQLSSSSRSAEHCIVKGYGRGPPERLLY